MRFYNSNADFSYQIIKSLLSEPRAEKRVEHIKRMYDIGEIQRLFPEFKNSHLIFQSRKHHPDPYNSVWDHTLHVIGSVGLSSNPILNVACFLHDVGKPETRDFNSEKNKVTFYQHHEIGEPIAYDYAVKMGFSHVDAKIISTLVLFHMHPIFLGSDEKLSKKGVRRFHRKIEYKVGKENFQYTLQALKSLVVADTGGRRTIDHFDEIFDLSCLERNKLLL